MNNTITTKIKKVTFGIIFSCLFLLSTISIGQQTDNWYFGTPGVPGKGLRIDFSSGTPVVTENYPLVTLEGSSSISDASGNPLFYTDGTKIWDASTNTTFATGLLGGASSTQSAIVMPKPGATNQWLVFTSGETAGASGTPGINYYTVSGSPGAFTISGATNLAGNNVVGEGLFIIGSTKPGSSFWVIARDNGSTGVVRAWDVSNTGAVNATAVTSTLSNTGWTQTNYSSNIGTIKSNTCQTQLAFTYLNTDIDLVDFNTATGSVVANTAKRINITAPVGNSGSYGIEFSQNDKYLYATNLAGDKLIRYDITAGTTNATFGSTSYPAGQLQLGPDGKIYMGIQGDLALTPSYLGVITNPGLAGATFSATGLQVSPQPSTNGFAYWGLPTFPKSLVVSIPEVLPGDGTYCVNTAIPLSYNFAGAAASQVWSVSPATGWSFTSGTATSVAPTITFTVSGNYTVTVDITDACSRHYIQNVDYVITVPKVPAGIISCGTGTITLTASGTVPADYSKYTWYDAASGGNVLGVGSPVTLNYGNIASTPTSVWVEVSSSVSTTTTGTNQNIGPASGTLTWGGRGTGNYSTTFSVSADILTLKSFVATPQAGSGTFDVEIKNGSSTVVFLKNYTVGAVGTPFVIDVNTDFPTGSYTITLKNSGTIVWGGGNWSGSSNSQIALPTSGGAGTYGIANLIYDYKNYSVTTTCSNRVKVDRKCLTVLPGDGTYCTNNDIPLSYSFEGTAIGQTWTITPGVLGTDWTYVTGTSTSPSPTIRFLTANVYTVSVAVTDVSTVVYNKSMTLTIIAGGTPAGTISCSAPNIIFTATGAVPADYSKYIWWDAATGGNIYGVGSPVTWNNPDNASSPTSVWVELGGSASSSAPVTNASVGPDPTYLSGASYQYHTKFDVLADHVTLNSFKLQPDKWPAASCPTPTNLSFTIEIRNAANTVVFLKPYSATVTCGSLITIPTGADLVKGNGYKLSLLSFTSNAGSFLQVSSAYPVTQAGVATITGPTANYTVIGSFNLTSNNFTITHNCNSRVKVDRLCSLPVELISFTGTNKGGKNFLNWTTTAEIDNDYFDLQRSTDGINFVTIGRIDGHGNSTVINNYQFIDANASAGINYYRLVQTDFDGNQSTSEVIKILSGFTNAASFIVSPNPSTESFGISFVDLNGGEITVLDVLGKELISRTIQAGLQSLELGADFAKGAYVIRFSGANGISTQLIIKE